MWRFLFLTLFSASAFAHPFLGFGQAPPPLPAKQNRIGDTISAYEREYFGLFKNTKDFAYATIGRQGQNGLVTVHYSNPSQTAMSIVIDDLALRDLYEFTNNYEYHARDEGKNFNPRRLVPLDPLLPMNKYERNGYEVDIDPIAGETQFGEILYVTDSTIAIWMLDVGYDWEAVQTENAKVFRIADLARIQVIRRISLDWIGGAIGAAASVATAASGNYFPNLENEYASTGVMTVGGFGLGFAVGYLIEELVRFKKTFKSESGISGKALTAEAKEYLRERSMFPGKLPPELVK